jgi:hypothetical protein
MELFDMQEQASSGIALASARVGFNHWKDGWDQLDQWAQSQWPPTNFGLDSMNSRKYSILS